jgi:hypothetical protein
MSETTDLLARIARLQEQIAQDQAQLSTARQEFRDRLVARLEFGISQKQQQLAEVQGQLTQAQQRDAQGTASAGQVVSEQANARDQNATVSNPPSPAQVVTPQTQQAQTVETGTNSRIRPTSETQATPPASPKIYQPPEVTTPGAQTVNPPQTQNQTGVGARNDDSTPRTTGGAQSVINVAFGNAENSKIVSQPNVLDQYASYTYAFSWYLLTPNQYNDIIKFKKYDCSNWELLIQTAGAPAQPPSGVAGRNQFFDLDYYMDDIEINTMIPLKGTGMAHSATSIKFKIVEPNGLTLINKLFQAVDNLYKSVNSTNSTTAGVANYPMAQYVLALRFYGYDENGVPVQIKNRVSPTDPLAAVEKFYPFVIANLRFRMANRAVEYEITGQPNCHFYNFGTDRGTIPFQFQLVGETVGDILQGRPVGTKYSVPEDGRKDSPAPPAGTITGDPNQDVGGGTTFSLGVAP